MSDGQPMSLDEATAVLTAPGGFFEIERKEIRGITVRTWKSAPRSLRDVFAMSRAHGDAGFLVYEDEMISFAEHYRTAATLAHRLMDTFGVEKGDRVAIAMRNLPEWVISFAAALSVGAISVSLNAWWTEDELAYAIEDSAASVVLADPERVARMAATCRRLGVRVIAVRSPADAGPGEGVDRYEDVVDLGRPLPEVEFGPESDATILYTSGTTGAPKGAVSPHRAVVQALMAFGCRQAIDFARGEGEPARAPSPYPPTLILAVPLFHVTGCIPVMLWAYRPRVGTCSRVRRSRSTTPPRWPRSPAAARRHRPPW